MSRPNSSVPSRWPRQPKGFSRPTMLSLYGSNGAISGAQIAVNTINNTIAVKTNVTGSVPQPIEYRLPAPADPRRRDRLFFEPLARVLNDKVSVLGPIQDQRGASFETAPLGPPQDEGLLFASSKHTSC